MKAINGFKIKAIYDLNEDEDRIASFHAESGVDIIDIEERIEDEFPVEYILKFNDGRTWWINYDREVIAVKIVFENEQSVECACETVDDQKEFYDQVKFLYDNGFWPSFGEQPPEVEAIEDIIF